MFDKLFTSMPFLLYKILFLFVVLDLTLKASIGIMGRKLSLLRRIINMAGNVSKNAHREGAKVLTSRWGGAIKMKSVFENGKLRHVAYCEKSGNTARKPKDLM